MRRETALKSRSDIVTMLDGSERVVTDIPALGYVYVPSVDPHETRPFLDPGDTAVSGMNLSGS